MVGTPIRATKPRSFSFDIAAIPEIAPPPQQAPAPASMVSNPKIRPPIPTENSSAQTTENKAITTLLRFFTYSAGATPVPTPTQSI